MRLTLVTLKNDLIHNKIMSAVSEIMSNKTILTVKLDSNLSALHISNLMIKNVDYVIVLDSKNLPVGIITEHDIVRKICAKNLVSDKIQCKEIMTSPIITIMSYDSIDSATKKMNKNKIKRRIFRFGKDK